MQKLSLEVDSIVAEMAPPAGAIGMLSSDDVTRLLRQAATRGAMAGWVQGERTARAYWGKELNKLRAQIKERPTTREEKIAAPGIYERAEDAYADAKQRHWVGLEKNNVG